MAGPSGVSCHHGTGRLPGWCHVPSSQNRAALYWLPESPCILFPTCDIIIHLNFVRFTTLSAVVRKWTLCVSGLKWHWSSYRKPECYNKQRSLRAAQLSSQGFSPLILNHIYTLHTARELVKHIHFAHSVRKKYKFVPLRELTLMGLPIVPYL